MMKTKIIRNQEDLTTGIFDQAGHKRDQKLGFYGILAHHKPRFTLVSNAEIIPT